jgi:hypothetical protein
MKGFPTNMRGIFSNNGIHHRLTRFVLLMVSSTIASPSRGGSRNVRLTLRHAFLGTYTLAATMDKINLEEWTEYDWDYDYDAMREYDFESACVECGDHGVSECDCCGASLCVMHSECQANFCMTCLKDPNFEKNMASRYGE